jgi:hypothetical protein
MIRVLLALLFSLLLAAELAAPALAEVGWESARTVRGGWTLEHRDDGVWDDALSGWTLEHVDHGALD